MATGAHEEVHVWSLGRNDDPLALWNPLGRVGYPAMVDEHKDDSVIVCDLHWISTPSHPQSLLVCYMHHGIV
ncbi:hypothetical protein CONPUDRAFT_159668 [Coniophora puteana RWD-64-598 SS2]|uniref:Uncharacterized protein n=1 Tax=Coniophora puteana (strain RWD-64-598) TaxID=741705 RepID=A0A5M3M7R3_CONPW|nr:uncharacterized protein CONPUDRAFT_159668 [Coniophora puteana RWD-64-598 SS2]EIW74894.1 hypothetical protein CONPUDRAFT_159668 [Coniophora puteana RWD-64-598 SS2]